MNPRSVRKLTVGVTGTITLATGVVLMPLPGPGTLIALAGLSILSREFPAAQRMVRRLGRTNPAAGVSSQDRPASENG
jgi:hypothetical protein